ncbi:MAG: hypothetical protein EXR98_09925 [Gemmataceae bacterium]|nr:hypothetical protein [Gemmataceae bacterium]
MNIRSFQPGDEFPQLKIYNIAAAGLTKFKPATIVDLQRRTQAKDFDPGTRCYAELGGDVVGYCTFQQNGRVGYPWCLPGFEYAAEPLFTHTLKAMKQRTLPRAFCAYRNDWPTINAFFQKHDFGLAREMVNYVLSFDNMPTPSAKLGSTITPATVEDIPGIYSLDPTVFRVANADALKGALWDNPWFSPKSLFVMRDRKGNAPQAAGIFITDAKYADPRAVDSSMPCFRFGAFGTEGMTAKRIKGLFSFVTRPDRNIFTVGMDMLSFAANRLSDADDITCYAAQVASDAVALHSFYSRVFERQGSFPVYERDLT